MCVVVFAVDGHPDHAFIVAANRDEFTNRPSERLAFWEDDPNVLAGRDLEAGGTWMGVTRSGRFAALTNHRGDRLDDNVDGSKRSRGRLVSDFLTSTVSAREYSERARVERTEYAGFNLIVAELRCPSSSSSSSTSGEVYFVRGHSDGRRERLVPGVYCLSNAGLDTPWFKVERLRSSFQEALTRSTESSSSLLDASEFLNALRDGTKAEGDRVQRTCLPYATEQFLSSVFIDVSEGYGTYSSSFLTVGKKDGTVRFTERTFGVDGTDSSFEFTIKESS